MIPSTPSIRRRGRALLLAALALAVVSALGAAGVGLAAAQRRHAAREALGKLPRAAARRTDLHFTVKAGGKVESTQRTLIECELERMTFSTHGQRLDAGGASRILELIPDGSTVKEGDILCRLDSSDYDELVIQQLIKVEEARAERLKADLDLKAATLAVEEFTDGTWKNQIKDYESKITLGEADLNRQLDRVQWARGMFEHGYLSNGQVDQEEFTLQKARVNLDNLRGAFANLKKYGGPLTEQTLRNRVETLRTDLDYQNLRVERMEERLETYRLQVERCTIRAPHPGFVIYANAKDNDPRIEVGATVKQRMDLFYLPDLSQMEVQAQVHETFINRVARDMPVRVRVEGLPRLELEGHVVKVDRVPIFDRNHQVHQDVKDYLTRVKLDTIPRGLLPGMTAQVEIETGHHDNALVVPAEAVAFEDGQEFCYIARPDGLERRQVHIGEVTPELLEITEGLAEGEEVVLDPSSVGSVAEYLPVDEAPAAAVTPALTAIETPVATN